jgi:hypothetical protein
MKKILGLIYHNDLDGLYSALAILKSNLFEIDLVFPVEYGQPHDSIKSQCDEFIIVDYADNITEEKTILWIDHHLKDEDFERKEEYHIKESPSCLRIIKEMYDLPELKEKIVDAIDLVDSADYSSLNPADVLFPSVDDNIGRMLMLNQLLMKNRKTNLTIELLIEDTFDNATLLYKLDNSKSTKTHIKDYYDSKCNLFIKLEEDENLIKEFEGIPVLMTNHFNKNDWTGYDRNVFYFHVMDKPYAITTFNFNNSFNFQVGRNPFYKEETNLKLNKIFEDEEELRGHENILNFKFDNKEEGLEKLDYVIDKLAKNI